MPVRGLESEGAQSGKKSWEEKGKAAAKEARFVFSSIIPRNLSQIEAKASSQSFTREAS